MKFIPLWIALVALPLSFATQAMAVSVGAKAPDFTGIDSHGKKVALSDFKGKFVVLEWHNQGCPFVKKHYDSGNMQKLQADWTKKGVVWLTIISSAQGKQGYVTPAEANAYVAEKKASPTAVILDTKSEIGKLYSAKTTPHMFVVNDKGVLIYNGAIDDKESTDKDDVKTANNYVSLALSQGKEGVVKTATTAPYGCSVKYAD